MKSINTIKKVSLATLLTLVLSISSVFGQNDTMYIIKQNQVWGKYKVSDVDSVIFYTPTITGGITTVTNPTTGKTWMDRNLGASQVATSSDDSLAYGDFYQWGRLTDGHEKRNSTLTDVLSSGSVPGHAMFITSLDLPYNWLITKNDFLWQGVNGINNPCPSGFRIPTAEEWAAEQQSWSSIDAAGAFASPLKLTVGGARYKEGNIKNDGANGYYWTSTVNEDNATGFYFTSSGSDFFNTGRVLGLSIRCIKD